MTVAQLIERLQQLEQVREITYFDGMYATEITKIDDKLTHDGKYMIE